MNIIEAVKSGKPFRRKSWYADAWVVIIGSSFAWDDGYCDDEDIIDPEDVIADDWETME